MGEPLWQSFLAIFESPWTYAALAWGLVIGSFLNVCIFRIPAGTFLKEQRSVCPSCGARIPAFLNIPVLSYLFLRGRSHCCKTKISLQYPLVELATGVLFVAVYWKYPIFWQNGSTLAWNEANILRVLHGWIFVSLLMVCAVIDLRLMIIPDVISLPMIALTPVVVYLHPDLTWLSALLGVLCGGLSLYAVAWLYWLLRKEVGMGMGDVKLLAAIGGWLGYQALVPTVFYGSLLGALIGLGIMVGSRKVSLRTAIPFGPFLAIGAIIHLILGSSLQQLLFSGAR